MANKHKKGNKNTRPKSVEARIRKELSSGNVLAENCYHQRVVPAKKGGPYNRSKMKNQYKEY